MKNELSNEHIGAHAYFTVVRELPISHVRRFVVNNTRMVETMPTYVVYREGSGLLLQVVPVPNYPENMFVDEHGWAFSARTISWLMREGVLSQPG